MLGRKQKGAGDEAWRVFLASPSKRPVPSDEKITDEQSISDPAIETRQADQPEQVGPESMSDTPTTPEKSKSPRVVAVLGSLATPRHRDIRPQD